MRRRESILAMATLAQVGRARSQGRPRVVGALLAEPAQAGIIDRALKEKGWAVGQSLTVEYRITNGDALLAETYARQLLALHPDVLFAVSSTSMAALHAAHSRIPTVFAMVSDPVEMHYIESFARPGGNVTGIGLFEPSLGGKWVALLKEAASNVRHIALVYSPERGNSSAVFRKDIDAVADRVGIASIETPRGNSADVDRLIRSLKDKPSSGLIFLPDAFTYAKRIQIVSLVVQCRLPAVYPFRAFCEAGGLVSYGVKINKIIASAVSYVDRILRGAVPAEMPVQAPTEFELVVSRTAASNLGLQLPPGLLARADEVLE